MAGAGQATTAVQESVHLGRTDRAQRQVCGRFTDMYTWEQLWQLYMLSVGFPQSNMQPNYNHCPTDPTTTILLRDGKRVFERMRWGLIPQWWNKPLKELRLATFNARAETVAERPMFRDLLRERRCVVPIDGYYEWRTTSSGNEPVFSPQ